MRAVKSVITALFLSLLFTLNFQALFISQDKVATKLESKTYKSRSKLGTKIYDMGQIIVENPFFGKNKAEYLNFDYKKQEPFFIPNTNLCIGFRKFGETAYYISPDGKYIVKYLFNLENHTVKLFNASGEYPDLDKLDKLLKNHIYSVLAVIKEEAANDQEYKALVKKAFKVTQDEVAIAKTKKRNAATDSINAIWNAEAKAKKEAYLANNYVLNPKRALPNEVNRIKINYGDKKTYYYRPYNRTSISGATFYFGNYMIYGQHMPDDKKFPASILKVENLGNEDAATSVKLFEYKPKYGFLSAVEGLNGDFVIGANWLLSRIKRDGTYNTLNLEDYIVTAVCEYDENTTVALASSLTATPHKFIKRLKRSRDKLYLIIWNHVDKKHTIIPIADKPVSPAPIIHKTKDGSILIAYDIIPSTGTKEHNGTISVTYPEGAYSKIFKLDISKCISTKKFAAKWGYTNKKLNEASLEDFTEDDNGNLVFVYKGAPKFHKGKQRQELHSAIYLEKLNASGKLTASYAYNRIEDNMFAELEVLKPTNGEYIYLGWSGKPFILSNPKGEGYIIAFRGAYDVVKDRYNKTFSQDLPLLIFHNGKDLSPESATFLEQGIKSSFHKNSMMNTAYKNIRNPMTRKFATKTFDYDKTQDRFILTEEVVSSNEVANKNGRAPVTVSNLKDDKEEVGRNYVWSIKYMIQKDDSRKSTGPMDITKEVAQNNPNKAEDNKADDSSSSEDNAGNYSGSITIHHDITNYSQDTKTIYIHYGGSNTSDVRSTTLGNNLSIPCRDEKIYYSFTGSKSNMKLIKQVTTDDCGTKIRTSSFL